MSKARIFNGYIVFNGEIERKAKFIVIGDYSDGAMCYQECDDNGEIIDDDTTYARRIIKVDGKNVSIFF